MAAIQLKPDEQPFKVAPRSLELLALFAAERCEARSIIAQTAEDPELLKDVQTVHDFAEGIYHGLTGKHLPMTVIDLTNPLPAPGEAEAQTLGGHSERYGA